MSLNGGADFPINNFDMMSRLFTPEAKNECGQEPKQSEFVCHCNCIYTDRIKLSHPLMMITNLATVMITKFSSGPLAHLVPIRSRLDNKRL